MSISLAVSIRAAHKLIKALHHKLTEMMQMLVLMQVQQPSFL